MKAAVPLNPFINLTGIIGEKSHFNFQLICCFLLKQMFEMCEKCGTACEPSPWRGKWAPVPNRRTLKRASSESALVSISLSLSLSVCVCVCVCVRVCLSSAKAPLEPTATIPQGLWLTHTFSLTLPFSLIQIDICHLKGSPAIKGRSHQGTIFRSLPLHANMTIPHPPPYGSLTINK